MRGVPPRSTWLYVVWNPLDDHSLSTISHLMGHIKSPGKTSRRSQL